MTDPIESIKNDAAPAVGADGQPVAGGEPGPGSGLAEEVKERFLRLFHPDPRVPDNFTDHWVAHKVDGKMGPESEEAQLGASAALCWDVLTEGGASGLPPVVHLGWSFMKYRRLKNTPSDPKAAGASAGTVNKNNAGEK